MLLPQLSLPGHVLLHLLPLVEEATGTTQTDAEGNEEKQHHAQDAQGDEPTLAEIKEEEEWKIMTKYLDILSQ